MAVSKGVAVDYSEKVIPWRIPVLITSATTTVIFTDDGVLYGIQIWTPVASGTFHFLDGSDAAIPGLPSAAAPAALDYPGQHLFPVPMPIAAGLKVVTTSATGVVMSVFTG